MAFQAKALMPLLALALASPGFANARGELVNQEQRFGTLAARDANFSGLSRATVRASCEATHLPEALATPNPLVDTKATRISVSFIIGTDGRVHSPLILQSLGPAGDRIILDAVRSWRYRPATCNGVPTEVEGTIAFSSR